MNLTDALACFRLTRLITTDKLTDPWRQRIWDRHPVDHGLGFALSCDWCTSIYVAVGILTARRFAPSTWKLAADGLAMSAITGLLARYVDN